MCLTKVRKFTYQRKDVSKMTKYDCEDCGFLVKDEDDKEVWICDSIGVNIKEVRNCPEEEK